jgi:hypothetical protein
VVASSGACRLPLAAGWTIVQVTGPAAPAGLAAWCACVGALMTRGRVIVCDLRHLTAADLTSVDAVARLCLGASRAGAELRILASGTALEELWAWAGLGPLGTGPAPGR